MDHRYGLTVDVEVTEATGYAERAAALAMLDRHALAAAAHSGGGQSLRHGALRR